MPLISARKSINSGYQKFRHGKIRSIIWPIRSFELSKFTPMACLMFSILLNQNIVRSLKDSLIMTQMGVEVINFIKLWCEMPLGVIFVLVYSKLCNISSSEKAFRWVISFFLLFYIVFAFLLYPCRDIIHPSVTLINQLILEYPNLKWFILMWGKWSFVIMYALGELWPLVVFSLLFWQLANKITKIDEATRFYPFFAVLGQANALIAGSIIMYCSSDSNILSPFFSNITDKTEVVIKSLTLVVVLTGAVIIYIQKYIDTKIIVPAKISANNKANSTKIKVSFLDSIKLIIQYPYLLFIAMIIILYNLSSNMIEGMWMYKIKESFPTMQGFINYQGEVLFWVGGATIFFAVIGSTLIKKFGWFSAAILTPFAMISTGILFFLGVINSKSIYYLTTVTSVLSPALLILSMGTIQYIFTKGLKFSLCDATREMLYIPMPSHVKTHGKAAVDIVGTKIGKSIGATIQILIFTIYPFCTYDDIAWVLMVIFTISCILWIIVIFKLDRIFSEEISK